MVIALTAEDIADLRRWLIAAAVVVLGHGAVAAAMVRWHEPVEPAEGGAIVIEFAPEQIAAPEQVQSDAVPDKPVEKVEKETLEKIEAKGEEAIEEKVEPTPPEQPREAVPVTTAPPPDLAKTAALPAGPVQDSPTRHIDKRAMQTWLGQISAALERHKRYPAAAHARHDQGVAQVSFTIDRQGHVIESIVVRSSGVADLDEEALALLQRTQPFPPLPVHEVGGERVTLTVPIRFVLK